MTEPSNQGKAAGGPLVGDRFLVAIWIALLASGLRVTLQLFIDRTVERLRGDLLWEHAVDHAVLVLTTPTSWLLVLALTILPRGTHPLAKLLRGFLCCGACLVLLTGWPDGEPQYLPGIWSLKGWLGWVFVVSGAVAFALFDRWAMAPRRLHFRISVPSRVAVTACVLLLGGGAIKATRLVLDARRHFFTVQATPPSSDLLERFRRNDGVVVEADVPVEIRSALPGRSFTMGGNRPSLVMVPDSEVTFSVRPQNNSRFCFSYGVDLGSLRFFEEDEDEPAVTFAVIVDHEQLFEDTLRPVGDESQQRWFDVDLDLQRFVGREVNLALRVRGSGYRASRLQAAFGRPLLQHSIHLPRASSSPEAPNVVLVVIDSLRADHVGSYGYPRRTTPSIDLLAEQSLTYDHAVSVSSWAWPSYASLVTGLYPPSHGVVALDRGFLSDSLVTVAELLQGAGITTGGWTANPLITRHKNQDQGFEVWREFLRKPGHLVTREFHDFLERYEKYQFFAYLHYIEPEAPYYPPRKMMEQFTGGDDDLSPNEGIDERAQALASGDTTARPTPAQLEQLVNLYDGEIAAADEQVRRVCQELQDRRLWDRTIVIVTSNQGEEFLEHGGITHGMSLHGESLRVPLIVRVPGETPRRISEATDLSRVAATILDLLGLGGDGHHRSPPLFPWATTREQFAFAHLHSSAEDESSWERWSIENEQWKLILDSFGGKQLYDLAADPAEQHPVQDASPRVAADLERRLAAWRADCERIAVEPPVETREDPQTRRVLAPPPDPNARSDSRQH